MKITKPKKEGHEHSKKMENFSACEDGKHMELVKRLLSGLTGLWEEAVEEEGRGEPGRKGTGTRTKRFSPGDDSRRDGGGNSFFLLFLVNSSYLL